MGLHKTSIFSIFIFIKDNDLKFCTRSYSSYVYHMMRFKGSNGKVCKMMTSRFKTLCQDTEELNEDKVSGKDGENYSKSKLFRGQYSFVFVISLALVRLVSKNEIT